MYLLLYLFKFLNAPLDFCPHSHTACPCVAWLFEQHRQLNNCPKQEGEDNDQLTAQNFWHKVCLQWTWEVLQKALNLLDPSHVKDRKRLLGIEALQKETMEALKVTRQELEMARMAQKVAEQRLELANSLHQDIIQSMQPAFYIYIPVCTNTYMQYKIEVFILPRRALFRYLWALKYQFFLHLRYHEEAKRSET